MKNILLILFFNFFLTHLIFSQSFMEICPYEITNGVVVDMEKYGDTIYSTGFFSNVCGPSTDFIGQYENNSWVPSAIEISDPGHSLRVIDNKLYIAKYEESIDSNWVYFYDGNNVQKMGKGIYLSTASGYSELPNVYDIIEYDGKIIACGEFDKVGAESINGIMQWNGNDWEALGSGLSGNISNTANVRFPHQMMVHNNELYVVGNFKNAGGMEVNGIAKWNGIEWSAMGTGFNNTVYSIAVFNDEIIAGGAFTASNGMPMNRIAKWNGTNWIPFNFEFTSTGPNDFIFVHTLKVFYEKLHIAGGLKEITYPNGSTELCGGIITYDGQSVFTYDQGIPNTDIEAVFVDSNENILIGGGVFGSGYWGNSTVPTAHHNLSNFQKIEIFPNPITDKIQINSEIDFTHFFISDILGHEVFTGKINSNEIDLRNLTAGVYFLNLKNKNISTVQKIVKN